MPKPRLRKYEVDEQTALECWRLAAFEIKQADARRLLEEPHYVELDARATARRAEDHWTFYAPSDAPVFFRLRVPYETMDICSAKDALSEETWAWIADIFPSLEIRRFQHPINENQM